MQTLKPSTRQLIESFRYRRWHYLPKDTHNGRQSRIFAAMTMRQDIEECGMAETIDSQIVSLAYRRSNWAKHYAKQKTAQWEETEAKTRYVKTHNIPRS